MRIPMVLSSSVPSSSVITTSSSLFAVHPNVMVGFVDLDIMQINASYGFSSNDRR